MCFSELTIAASAAASHSFTARGAHIMQPFMRCNYSLHAGPKLHRLSRSAVCSGERPNREAVAVVGKVSTVRT
jgi:hypothetical protein